MFVETADPGVALTASGWTELLSRDLNAVLSGNTRLTILWRIVSNPGTDNRTTNDTGNHQLGAIIGITAGTFDAGDPFNVTDSALGTPNSTSVSVLGAVTTVADCLCFAVATGQVPDADSTTEFGAPTNASLTSLTEQVDNTTSLGNGGALWVVSGEKATAGTVDATTCTAATSAFRAYGFLAVQPPSVQALTGTLFTKAPTFNTGAITSVRALTGTLFTKAPTFNTGTVTATRNLAGVLFIKAPTFPTGAVATGAVSLAGTLFVKAPSFFVGAVTPGAVTLTGTLFTKAPTFFTGAVTSTRNLAGVLFAKAPTFPTGAVSLGAGSQALSGTLFVKAPTFPTGAVTATYTLTGSLFTKAPIFPVGVLTLGAAPQPLAGVLFTKAPTFPTGSITTGAVTLTGSLFQKAPTFPTGTITAGAVTVSGVLFTKAPTFPTGAVAATYTFTGVLFVKAPTFPAGSIGIVGVLAGVLFQKAPTFFVGTLLQTGGSFWTRDPVGYTLNPVSFVRIGPGDLPPWAIRIHGETFRKAPTFTAGSVT